MITVNFKEKLPEFAIVDSTTEAIKTRYPDDVFVEQKKREEKMVLFNLKCSCKGTTECGNMLNFYYDGLERYTNSNSVGHDTKVNVLSNHKPNTSPGVLIWDPSEENVAELTSFLKVLKEAIIFKRSLLDGLCAKLEVRIDGHPNIEILIRKGEDGIRLLLFEIPDELASKIPLLSESGSYKECLGTVAILPAGTDLGKIRNEFADMMDPLFGPVAEWISLLGKENNLNLQIDDIWVIPQ